MSVTSRILPLLGARSTIILMKATKTTVPLERLLEQLPENYTLADRELIHRAYRVAEEAHRDQKRHSGEPYINHCLAVASILADLRVPPEVVAAGLLHDTVEDTTITLNDIKRDFGDTIAVLVDGVTKLTNLPRVSRDDQHAEKANGSNGTEPAETAPDVATLGRKQDLVSETLRKTFLAMGDDVRVVLIKLADRLHNMRTLGFMPEHKRKRIAKETLDIFAPLANRLGIWQIKWELEDLGFRYVNPEKYKEIAEQIQERRPDRETQIESIKTNLVKLLDSHNIRAEISGRPKHIYSIYKKMTQKGKPFDLVRDVRAVRLIVPDVPSCYAALGVIHTHWRPIPGEFDDYIAAPKDNFYQSLHTAVIYDDKRPLEVQIRTPEMHQNAEYGIAAHWRYKEGTHRDKSYEQRINWLRNMMEWRTDVNDAQEFVEGMKTDVFQDRVYVFTPRGDIIDLSAGSTPIDFAYHVHTDIGHRCRGARVNGKLVPLYQDLKTGDQVEILTAKRGGPSRDWLNPNLGLVKTQRARSKIKAWFKKQEDEQNLAQGRATLERELQRLGITSTNFEKLARELGFKIPEEMFIALGNGDLSVNKVIRQLSETVQTADILEATIPAQETKPSTDVVEVVGLKGLLSTMARCCNPMPGDQIVGYITRGRGATIHRQDCPNILRRKDTERLLQVDWGKVERTFPVQITVKAYDRQGLMGDISTLLQGENVNIADVSVNYNRTVADIKLVIEIRDLAQLSRVLTRIENLPNVLEAQRTKPG
ncbi:MAG TPA: bifunctional (p)ppGpp synthetase/guanosine-3',5'-bis(diphosphate) 3'-pyrophosphohydrolase [Anaerolineales bacterium]